MARKTDKPLRSDEYLNRNMPDRVKNLNSLHRKTMREEQRKKWISENPPKK